MSVLPPGCSPGAPLTNALSAHFLARFRVLLPAADPTRTDPLDSVAATRTDRADLAPRARAAASTRYATPPARGRVAARIHRPCATKSCVHDELGVRLANGSRSFASLAGCEPRHCAAARLPGRAVLLRLEYATGQAWARCAATRLAPAPHHASQFNPLHVSCCRPRRSSCIASRAPGRPAIWINPRRGPPSPGCHGPRASCSFPRACRAPTRTGCP